MLHQNQKQGAGRRIASQWLWYYLLIIGAGAVLVIIAIAAVTVTAPRKVDTILKDNPAVVTAEDIQDQLGIKNVLNRFYLEGRTVPDKATDDERAQLLVQSLKLVQRNLNAIDAYGSTDRARSDVLELFRTWEQRLVAHEDTADLREEFKTIGKKYPWLDALAWLILLNRL